MRNRFSRSVVLVMAMAAVLASACENDTGTTTPLQPTRISSVFAPAFAIGVRPALLRRRLIPGALCPFQHPFLVPFELLLQNTSSSLLSLNRVGLHFFDSFGIAGPDMFVARPNLERRFGTVGIPPLTSRTFPFSLEFGCGTEPIGTLSVTAETVDDNGASNEQRVTIVIR